MEVSEVAPRPHPDELDATISMQDGKWAFIGKDGIKFEYDPALSAWFPVASYSLIQITDDLLKAQQSAYSVEGVDEAIPEKLLKVKRKREQKPKEEVVKEEKINTAIYVTGLPHDTTIEEVAEVFKLAGVFFIDPISNEPKIKLYKDSEGKLKGDALVMYLREESVALAVDLLDDSPFRFNESSVIKVQAAEFKEKDPNLIKKTTVDKKKKNKVIQKLNKQLEWDEDIAAEGPKNSKHLKLVVLRHMFTPKELEEKKLLTIGRSSSNFGFERGSSK